jgi:DNA-binding response OmpR family regulator
MTAPRILVMEDNTDLLRLYGKALSRASYQVYPVTTIQEAQHLLTQCHFDLFLCDIHMGDGLGTNLLRRHMDWLRGQGTQIVVASAQSQYRPMCEEMGVDFYLEKPIALETLLTMVKRLTA